MSIFVITANAQKDVYFATHRLVQNMYGETFPKNFNDAYCPTQIEVDYSAKTLLVKTTTYSFSKYTFSNTNRLRKDVVFYNEENDIIGTLIFNSDTGDFWGLRIEKEDDTHTLVCYINKKNQKSLT